MKTDHTTRSAIVFVAPYTIGDDFIEVLRALAVDHMVAVLFTRLIDQDRIDQIRLAGAAVTSVTPTAAIRRQRIDEVLDALWRSRFESSHARRPSA